MFVNKRLDHVMQLPLLVNEHTTPLKGQVVLFPPTPFSSNPALSTYLSVESISPEA